MSVVDWNSYPSPWRELGHEWCEMLPTLIEGETELEQDRFGKVFRAWRIRRSLSQAEIGRMIGVGQSIITRLEHGQLLPTNPAFARAQALVVGVASTDTKAAA